VALKHLWLLLGGGGIPRCNYSAKSLKWKSLRQTRHLRALPPTRNDWLKVHINTPVFTSGLLSRLL
jgi:hypothetical protein